MPHQNRVKPNGEIVASPERGTMMGNRGGKFHRDDKTLGKRRWASTHWICCDLHWKDAHHEPMSSGYTSLFFLDEVTALSAGHRPCFYCRRKEAKAFLGDVRVGEFDKVLHAERLAKISHPSYDPLPQGTMFEMNSSFYALKNHSLLRWSFSGYTAAVPFIPCDKILTPPSIIAILQKGYQPRWHESALQWDLT
jgi:hypothetical protein